MTSCADALMCDTVDEMNENGDELLITELTVKIANAGAGNVIMWFMVVLSLISIVLIIERFLHFRRACGDLEIQYARLSAHLRNEEFMQALDELKDDMTMVGRVARTGLNRLHHGRQAVQESMAAATLLERQKGERFLSVLGTLGANAPFIGLLGTVVEIIHTLSNSGSMTAERIPQMMADLSTALAATAVGLLVALPAVAANNYFRRRLQTMESAASAIGHELISYANLPHPEREQ